MKYVAGLLFTKSRKHVALVRKNKPDWQKGKLNAIGGKIEGDETPLQAMQREFREETGVDRAEWERVVILDGPGFEVHFFAAFDDECWDVETVEQEPIEVHFVENAIRDKSLIPNLRVVMAIALDDTGIAKPVMLQDLRAA